MSLNDGTVKRGKAIMICAQNEIMQVARIEELIRKEIKTIKAPGVTGDARGGQQQGWQTASRVPHSMGDPDSKGGDGEDEDDEYSGYGYQPRNPFRY
jgi:hypothetical protein